MRWALSHRQIRPQKSDASPRPPDLFQDLRRDRCWISQQKMAESTSLGRSNHGNHGKSLVHLAECLGTTAWHGSHGAMQYMSWLVVSTHRPPDQPSFATHQQWARDPEIETQHWLLFGLAGTIIPSISSMEEKTSKRILETYSPLYVPIPVDKCVHPNVPMLEPTSPKRSKQFIHLLLMGFFKKMERFVGQLMLHLQVRIWCPKHSIQISKYETNTNKNYMKPNLSGLDWISLFHTFIAVLPFFWSRGC